MAVQDCFCLKANILTSMFFCHFFIGRQLMWYTISSRSLLALSVTPTHLKELYSSRKEWAPASTRIFFNPIALRVAETL